MDYEQLSETTMDPKSRTLLKINLADAERASATFDKLMGKNVENRKKFIEENANKVTLDI